MNPVGWALPEGPMAAALVNGAVFESGCEGSGFPISVAVDWPGLRMLDGPKIIGVDTPESDVGSG